MSELNLPELPEDYEYVEQIGSGSQGIVWKILNKNIGTEGRFEVVKILEPLSNQSEELAEKRFCREFQTALDHPNIVRIYSANPVQYFFIMEHLPRGNFHDFIYHPQTPLASMLEGLKQIGEGLYFAHNQGLVHRDLKPENILFSHNMVPKITDFGVAKWCGQQQQRITQTCFSPGTPLYMSPEQWTDPEKVDHRSDIWALGVILYQILNRRPPFLCDEVNALMYATLHKKIPSLNKDIWAGKDGHLARLCAPLCRKALEKNPNNRYQSARDFSHDIESILPSNLSNSEQVFLGPDSFNDETIVDRSLRGKSGQNRYGLILVFLALFFLALSSALFLSQKEKAFDIPDPYEPNNTSQEAYLISEGSYSGFLGKKEEDWFKVLLSGPTTIDLRLKASFSKGDLDLSLYDEHMKLLAESNTSRDEELIQRQVEKTDFVYVLISSYKGGNNNYDLKVKLVAQEQGKLKSKEAIDDRYEPNNEQGEARLMQELSWDGSLRLGDEDWFKIYLYRDAKVSLEVRSLDTLPLHLELHDAAKGKLKVGKVKENKSSVEVVAKRGTILYIRINGATKKKIDYNVVIEMKTQTTHQKNSYEPNNDFSLAQPLKLPKVVSYLGKKDEDWFILHLSPKANKKVQMKMRCSSEGIHLEVYDSENKILGESKKQTLQIKTSLEQVHVRILGASPEIEGWYSLQYREVAE